jgi:hypothetical protein
LAYFSSNELILGFILMTQGLFKITLFTTLGCHLCEDALAMLRYYQEEIANVFEIEQVEIIDSERLIEAYGTRIPVLLHSETQQEIGWPFNMEQLAIFLKTER